MLKYALIILAALAILTVAFLGVRGTTSTKPPIIVFDDMDDQLKLKNQGGSSFFADGREMRPVPAGAIPWGRNAAKPDKSLIVDDLSAFELKTNPTPITAPMMQRGQKLYSTYCVVCHGGFGDGKGVTTNYGIAPPANFHSDRLRQVTDGYLYRVITEGKGLMGPYGYSIDHADRWAVVAYVRAIQRAGNAKLEDIPANQRQELEGNAK